MRFSFSSILAESLERAAESQGLMPHTHTHQQLKIRERERESSGAIIARATDSTLPNANFFFVCPPALRRKTHLNPRDRKFVSPRSSARPHLHAAKSPPQPNLTQNATGNSICSSARVKICNNQSKSPLRSAK